MESRRKAEDRRAVYFVAALLAAVVGGSVYYGYRHRIQTLQTVAAHVKSWPEGPRLMAELLMERHGPPHVYSPTVATWLSPGPWKRISVHGDSRERYLEQAVGYLAPPAAAASLREFGHGVRLDLVHNELSAASGREALNYLALNLADEVASGRRSAQDAGDYYRSTADLSEAGKSSPYLEKLLFKPYRFRSDWSGRVIGN